MKKYKKKEMLELVSALAKVNENILKAYAKTGSAVIMNALADCQETALLLGNYLETMGHKGEGAVHILEEYCENIYQMSVNGSKETVCRKISKRIKKQLGSLTDYIKYTLPDDKKEIVFFPYKASMWDSLESVWKAAAEDENCITYVIPIPYFDKNPDNSLGQMHYEGDQYPEYVPVTSWEEYDIEKHRPDIAYMHNPYDDWNFVTCIHPIFFARELKKYVDMLVYIPYFICANNQVSPHFCVTPVTILADRIVVQSEEVRRTYIRELRKYEKENQCVGVCGNIEKKVVALGSPKYDRIILYEEYNVTIPEEWKNVIYRTDGGRKKIILYNTSIQSILNYREQMLNKVEDSINVFEMHQDDIALLWRPHPLLPATLKSMLPELWEKYRHIVDYYKKGQWGIFDESSDMDRAVAISDAYYGDGGSLLDLYRKTGKPVMLQEYKIIYGGTEENERSCYKIL